MQVVDGNGVVVDASANIPGDVRISRLDPDADGYAAHTVAGIGRQGDGPYRVVARRVDDGDRVVRGLRGAQPRGRGPEHRQPGAAARGGRCRRSSLLMGAVTWVVTGRALRPVEAIRQRGRGHRRRGPAPTRARTGERGRDRPPRPHDERDARPPRGRHRPATALRRRRQPRAAQPAHRDPRPARGRPRAPGARRLADHRAGASSPTRSGMQRLVDDLLAIAVVDASALDAAHRAPVDLDEIVLAETRRLQHAAARSPSTPARCRARRSTATPTSSCAVVRNLLDNAASPRAFARSSCRSSSRAPTSPAGRRRRSRHPRRRP